MGKTNPSDINGAYQGVNDVFPRVNRHLQQPGVYAQQPIKPGC